MSLCAPLQLADKKLDHLGEWYAAPADRCGLVDQGRPQNRLQRPHQAALVLLHIGGDRLRTEEHAAMGFKVEEDRAGNERVAILDRRQCRHAVADHAECRVRRAEIQSTRCHDRPVSIEKGLSSSTTFRVLPDWLTTP